MTRPSSPQPDNVQVRYVPASGPQKRHPLRRPGCVAALVLWFALLIVIPVALFMLLTQGQIVIPLGDAPEQEVRIWLLSEAQVRGFGIANAWQAARSETAVCVEHDVRFLLWMGEQAPSRYCECYARVDATADWSFLSGGEGACDAG